MMIAMLLAAFARADGQSTVPVTFQVVHWHGSYTPYYVCGDFNNWCANSSGVFYSALGTGHDTAWELVADAQNGVNNFLASGCTDTASCCESWSGSTACKYRYSVTLQLTPGYHEYRYAWSDPGNDLEDVPKQCDAAAAWIHGGGFGAGGTALDNPSTPCSELPGWLRNDPSTGIYNPQGPCRPWWGKLTPPAVRRARGIQVPSDATSFVIPQHPLGACAADHQSSWPLPTVKLNIEVDLSSSSHTAATLIAAQRSIYRWDRLTSITDRPVIIVSHGGTLALTDSGNGVKFTATAYVPPGAEVMLVVPPEQGANGNFLGQFCANDGHVGWRVDGDGYPMNMRAYVPSTEPEQTVQMCYSSCRKFELCPCPTGTYRNETGVCTACRIPAGCTWPIATCTSADDAICGLPGGDPCGNDARVVQINIMAFGRNTAGLQDTRQALPLADEAAFAAHCPECYACGGGPRSASCFHYCECIARRQVEQISAWFLELSSKVRFTFGAYNQFVNRDRLYNMTGVNHIEMVKLENNHNVMARPGMINVAVVNRPAIYSTEGYAWDNSIQDTFGRYHRPVVVAKPVTTVIAHEIAHAIGFWHVAGGGVPPPNKTFTSAANNVGGVDLLDLTYSPAFAPTSCPPSPDPLS